MWQYFVIELEYDQIDQNSFDEMKDWELTAVVGPEIDPGGYANFKFIFKRRID